MRPPHMKNLGTRTKILLCIVFILAFSLRVLYLIQISDAPYFESPAGDSKFIFERAQDILNGDIIGTEINFHSSPAYPYFIAVIFWLSKNNFLVLGIIQILIGSLNCLLIFLLAKKISQGKNTPALIAGVMAALYGILAFFDADILAIFFTLVFVTIALLLLIDVQQSHRRSSAILAGIALGCAALDRTNILLFVPVAAWFLASEFSFNVKSWKWKPAILFIVGTVLVVLPFTLRNYFVDNDFVLVSSNAGINLYIGNNPQANGVFSLPRESGLSNYDLYGSSVETAEHETGRQLKPSHVSRFWAQKALTFIIEHPVKELQLVWRKFLLLWNFYEIPNHLNFYYIRTKSAPILHMLFVGFWLVAPLAVVGIAWKWKQGLRVYDKLLIAFLITYMLSLLPFFITARYRLPMVPVLIVFASGAVVEIWKIIKQHRIKQLLWMAIGLILVSVFVNWQRIQFSYSYQRIIIGTRYVKRALENPQSYYRDFYKAIIELKWAVEIEPFDAHAHYQLGKAYASIGYYSGAVDEWTITTTIDREYPSAGEVLEIARDRLETKGDIVTADDIPKTPYEEAQLSVAQKQYNRAGDIYRKIIREDPFHFQAWNDLGLILFETGKHDQAIDVLTRGLHTMPDNFYLVYTLAGIYYRLEEREKAKQLLEQYREIDPNNIRILELLDMLKK
jgi:tetratricopeptide (TPR) repeat protein